MSTKRLIAQAIYTNLRFTALIFSRLGIRPAYVTSIGVNTNAESNPGACVVGFGTADTSTFAGWGKLCKLRSSDFYEVASFHIG